MKAAGLTITGLTRTLFMSRTDVEAVFTSATQEVRSKVKVKKMFCRIWLVMTFEHSLLHLKVINIVGGTCILFKVVWDVNVDKITL